MPSLAGAKTLRARLKVDCLAVRLRAFRVESFQDTVKNCAAKSQVRNQTQKFRLKSCGAIYDDEQEGGLEAKA